MNGVLVPWQPMPGARVGVGEDSRISLTGSQRRVCLVGDGQK